MTIKSVASLFGRIRNPLSWDGNPIMVKELRALFRGWIYVSFLTVSILLLSILILAIGITESETSDFHSNVGQMLYSIFFFVAILVLGIVAPSQGASSLSGEREGRTLESILLSGLSAWKIIWGKYLSAFASLFIVLMSYIPIVAIAFIFGGISPYHIFLGYLYILIFLAPCLAFGIAVSAHMKSSKVSTIISVLASSAVTIVFLIILTEMGDSYRIRHGGGMQGPLWFIDFLIADPFKLEIFGPIIFFPISLSLLMTWFFLASALSAIRPPAHNRVQPLKIWAVTSAAWFPFGAASALLPMNSSHELEDTALAIVALSGFLSVLYVLIFINEPALKPRSIVKEQAKYGLIRKFFAFFGPGAAQTLRFSFLLLIGTAALFPLSVFYIVKKFSSNPALINRNLFVCLIVISIGHCAIACALAALGTWIRILTKRGVIARISLASFLIVMIFLTFFSLSISSISSANRDAGFLVLISPLFPTILATYLEPIAFTSNPWSPSDLTLLFILYSVVAAGVWTLVEYRVFALTRTERKRREERAKEHRLSVPSLPLLQIKRSSMVPVIEQDEKDKPDKPDKQDSQDKSDHQDKQDNLKEQE